MREDDLHPASTAVAEPPGPPGPPDSGSGEGHESAGSPWWAKLLTGLAYGIGALAIVLAAAYNFGSMMPPSQETTAQYDQLVESGQAQPAGNGQFHIPIPGCVCHSDKPATVMAHKDRRIRQCSSCHGG